MVDVNEKKSGLGIEQDTKEEDLPKIRLVRIKLREPPLPGFSCVSDEKAPFSFQSQDFPARLWEFGGVKVCACSCDSFADVDTNQGDLTGILVWPGARTLCAFITSPQGRALLQDKVVIDLGAGTGRVSNSTKVVLCDGYRDILPLIMHNIALTTAVVEEEEGNTAALAFQSKFIVAGKVWDQESFLIDYGQHTTDEPVFVSEQPNVVLAADITYELRDLRALTAELCSHIKRPGDVGIVLHISRDPDIDDAYKKSWQSAGFEWIQVPFESFMEQVPEAIVTHNLYLLSRSSE